MKETKLSLLYEQVALAEGNVISEGPIDPRMVYSQILRHAESALQASPQNKHIQHIILIAKQQLFYSNTRGELDKDPTVSSMSSVPVADPNPRPAL